MQIVKRTYLLQRLILFSAFVSLALSVMTAAAANVTPTISKITSTGGGNYTADPANNKIVFDVMLPDTVISVTGAPYLTLNGFLNTTGAQATYKELVQEGTKKGMRFEYTVQPGDFSAGVGIAGFNRAGAIISYADPDEPDTVTAANLPAAGNILNGETITIRTITFADGSTTKAAGTLYKGDELVVEITRGGNVSASQAISLSASTGGKVTMPEAVTIAANESSVSCTLTLAAATDGPITITFRPSNYNGDAGNLTLTLTIVEATNPYIVAVHNDGEDKTYSVGETIHLAVEVNDEIDSVSGAPLLVLDILNQDTTAANRSATFVEYEGKFLCFDYVVKAGDFTEDLDCVSKGFNMNGATITINGQNLDRTGRNAMPVGATEGSLSQNAAIVIATITLDDYTLARDLSGREGDRLSVEITRREPSIKVQGFDIKADQEGKVDWTANFSIPRNEESAFLDIDLVEATTTPLTLTIHPNGYAKNGSDITAGDIVLSISITPDPIVPKVLLSGVVSAIEGEAPFPILVSLDRAPRETIFVSVETSDASKLAIVGCDGDFRNITEEEVVLAFRKGQIGPFEVMLAPRQGVEMGGSPIVVSATADQTYDAAFLPITVLGKAPVATVFPIDGHGTWTLSGFTAGQYVNFSWLAEDSATDIAEGITALVDFGDGTSDCVICNANGIGTARHKYSEAGYYFLMLTLVDKSGYRSSLLGQVTVEQAANPITGQGGGGSSSSVCVQDPLMLSVTNIVIHYVTQSIPSDAVIPPIETGIVNVLTEVSAGSAIAIPSDWAAQYPSFANKFGDDFGAAITKPSGKRDGAGNQMFVWQDFVAGTDPTNLDDVLLASITYDAQSNEPIISWSPELSVEEAAKRSYKIYGKVHLTDDNWILVNGNAAEFNFFKVTVEMK